MKKGILYGVGVGPGDPELLTVKARRILSQADVIAVPDKGGGEDRPANHRESGPGQADASLLHPHGPGPGGLGAGP